MVCYPLLCEHYLTHVAGQTCAAGTRVYVQEGIYDKFVEAFKARTAQTKLGDPFEADTFQGPQISQKQVDRIMGYVHILYPIAAIFYFIETK